VIYDLIEQMGNADEAIADYRTRVDVSRWPARLRARVRVEPIVSGDRDLVPAELPGLRDKYGAAAGDWESGAIAWVATHNHTRVLILRGITDLVDDTGDPTYGDTAAWARAARTMMQSLVGLLGDALPEL
jgi:adenosylhomocysteine nucleosidase